MQPGPVNLLDQVTTATDRLLRSDTHEDAIANIGSLLTILAARVSEKDPVLTHVLRGAVGKVELYEFIMEQDKTACGSKRWRSSPTEKQEQPTKKKKRKLRVAPAAPGAKVKRNTGEPAFYVNDKGDRIACPGPFWRSEAAYQKRRSVIGMRNFSKIKKTCTGHGTKERWYTCRLEGKHHGCRLCKNCGKAYLEDRRNSLIRDKDKPYAYIRKGK